MNTTALRGFIGAVLDTKVTEVAPAMLRRASAVVWDTVSVAWMASADPEVQALAGLAGGVGRSSTILHGSGLVGAEGAAFVNGTAAVWCEMDEGFRGTGHPGAHVVSAGVALAEERSQSGPDLLMSVLRGYTTLLRISSATRGTLMLATPPSVRTSILLPKSPSR